MAGDARGNSYDRKLTHPFPTVVSFRRSIMNDKGSRGEVAQILQNFLDGTGGKWDWDDFTSAMSFEDPYLEKIRARCLLLDREFPPTIRGWYCNEQGLEVIRAYIQESTKSK